MGGRDHVAAGEAARRAIARANAVRRSRGARGDVRGLPAAEAAVFQAVLAVTVTYSKVDDEVYLADLAARAYAVEEPEPWQIKGTGAALRSLHRQGVITAEAPLGRPRTNGRERGYWVSLDPPETDPLQRPTFQEDGAAKSGPRERTETDPLQRTPPVETSVEEPRALTGSSSERRSLRVRARDEFDPLEALRQMTAQRQENRP